jgi:hypothetical protein
MAQRLTYTWQVGKLPPKVELTAPCWLHEEEEDDGEIDPAEH